MGHTVAEKILARAAGKETVSPGDHVVCDVDVAMTQDIHSPAVVELLQEQGPVEVWDPDRWVVVFDHVAPSHTKEDADTKRVVREFLREHGISNFYDVGSGISHEVLPEHGHVRPGELVVGTDSHTVSHGAFGAAGTGIGDTDMVYALRTGQTWFRVPKTIEFRLDGAFDDRVATKDVLLHIAGEYGTDVARYRSVEFTGRAVEEAALDDRITLSNMSIELGAKFGFTPADDAVVDYVSERTDEPFEPVHADEDAEYERTYRIDVSELDPQVAVPHDVQNVVPVGETAGVELDQVFVGTCTNGKYEDLKAAAELLEGRQIDSSIRMVVTPASRDIQRRIERDGILATFLDAGATVTNPTCGACIGLGMGLLGDDEVCLAAQNRNFRGRMGSNDSEIYISSPETAAASALTGRITDPREV